MTKIVQSNRASGNLMQFPGVQMQNYIYESMALAPKSEVPQAYVNVCQRAGRLLDPDFESLSFDDINYVTDLGLRVSDEPRLYFESNTANLVQSKIVDLNRFFEECSSTDHAVSALAKKLGLSSLKQPLFDSAGAVGSLLADAHYRLIRRLMFNYVNYLGSWEDGEAIAREVLRHAQDTWVATCDDGAYLLNISGNILGCLGDVACRELYLKAFEAWNNPYQKFFSLFRLAVAEVKKFRSAGGVEAGLRRAFDYVETLPARGCSREDSRFTGAMLKNLEALDRVYAKDFSAAERLVQEAWVEMQGITNESLGFDADMANRYRVQVIENCGLLASIQDKWDLAIKLFEEGASFSIESHAYSVDETLSILAYGYLRTGQPDKALGILGRCESMLADEPSPLRQIQVWKMLAVATDAIGDKAASAAWIGKINSNLAILPTSRPG